MKTMFDISRMSPEMQAQALRKMQAQIKPTKYHSEPDMRGNLKFDSKKEARRYDELSLLLKAGKIRDLRLQVEFTLQGAYTTPGGNRIRAIRYLADFTYEEHGELVVEDVKSKATMTRVYAIKKKLLYEKYGITIREV